MNWKSPKDMTLDELLAAEKERPLLTDAEKEEQVVAMALAELRNDGDDTSTEEDVRVALKINKASKVA